MFLISNALSNATVPSGKTFLSSKKLDVTLETVNGETFQVFVFNSSPSNVSPTLSGEYPTEPFLKKSEAQSLSSNTLTLLQSFVS